MLSIDRLRHTDLRSRSLQRAMALAGYNLQQLASMAGLPIPPDLRRDKGWIGQLIEWHLGASAGSKPKQDLPGAGDRTQDAAHRPRCQGTGNHLCLRRAPARRHGIERAEQCTQQAIICSAAGRRQPTDTAGGAAARDAVHLESDGRAGVPLTSGLGRVDGDDCPGSNRADHRQTWRGIAAQTQGRQWSSLDASHWSAWRIYPDASQRFLSEKPVYSGVTVAGF